MSTINPDNWKTLALQAMANSPDKSNQAQVAIMDAYKQAAFGTENINWNSGAYGVTDKFNPFLADKPITEMIGDAFQNAGSNFKQSTEWLADQIERAGLPNPKLIMIAGVATVLVIFGGAIYLRRK